MPTTSPQDPYAVYRGTGEVRALHRFDVQTLEDYLCDRLAGFERPLSVRQFNGGQSNPTYSLGSPAGNWVLRRKPPGELLPSAHAVDREYRVIAALGLVGYPVPRADLLCEDESIVGTAFYVMEQVEGRVLWDPLLPDQRPDERRAIYNSLIDAMAELHQADYEAIGLGDFGRPGNYFAAIGLGDFGRPGNYFARQINRWSKQYVASETENVPEMNRLMEWLPANVPEDDSVSLVHGDFKLDNTIVHPTEPRVIAVLDWELSTLGHPLGDLTYMLSSRQLSQSPFAGLSDDNLMALGIPTDREFVERYSKTTRRSFDDGLDFYIAYNLFRTAAIYQGILGRVRDGTAASANVTGTGDVRPIALRAMDFARKLGA
ncbi:MAG: phosphotransferase family protein [Deltaproteobacteria bacterium]|nr:phosphotransferase family protein [Deltaproteobacteria bacterium]